ILFNNLLKKFDIRQYTELTTLFYILAERNLADLIRIYPQKESCFNIKDKRYRLLIFAALATRSNNIIQIFLKI
ncbi:hypothetical protein BKA65DRAFT_411301, partial [Rhexocercosporidium sp. MPI-PUGE-AT-0058]